MSKAEAGPKRSFNVFVRHITVHDDHDPGPGKGEFELVFAAVGVPRGSDGPASVEWRGSVSDRRSYDVAMWTGSVAVPDGGKISVAGRGLEQDSARHDEVRGGIATFTADEEWGQGKWWRTTNGRDFDFTFCVTLADEANEAARPTWTDETYDAPGPDRLDASAYRSILE
jgi:hypothetical protein